MGCDCNSLGIDYNVLYVIVFSSRKKQLCISREERAVILDNAQKQQLSIVKQKDNGKELGGIKKRLRELENIIGKLSEDNTAGRPADTRMNKLLPKYEQEAEVLEKRMAAIETAKHTSAPSEQVSRDKLDKLLRQFPDVTELTPKLLFKLIDHIEIGQGHYEKGANGKVKRQAVKIFYRFQTQAAVKEYAK